MRADMFKVIVERPRRGGSWSKEARGFWGSEDTPGRLGMRRGHRHRKTLNENLAPLRRFLVRRAGRPWDAVFSEICAVIDNRSTVKQHIHSHIEDFVAVQTRLIDGEVFAQRAYMPLEPLRDLRQPLYVDPLTGLLKRNEERAMRRQTLRKEATKRQAELDARRRNVSSSEQLHRVDGIWYMVRVSCLPEVRKETRVVNGEQRDFLVYERRWDALRKGLVSRRELYVGEELYGRRGLYATTKRQLAERDLRRYGLKKA